MRESANPVAAPGAATGARELAADAIGVTQDTIICLVRLIFAAGSAMLAQVSKRDHGMATPGVSHFPCAAVSAPGADAPGAARHARRSSK